MMKEKEKEIKRSKEAKVRLKLNHVVADEIKLNEN